MKLIHGDCLPELMKMADKSVDLCLTDPPYGLKIATRGKIGGPHGCLLFRVRRGARGAALLSLVRAAFCGSRGLDFPCRIVRNVHGEIAARPSQFGHIIAGKGFAPGDPGIFAAAFHVRLRGIQIAGVEGREDHIAVLVGQRASAINVFLITRFHAGT